MIRSYNLVRGDLTGVYLGLVGILRGLISTSLYLTVRFDWLRLLLCVIVLDVLIVLRVVEWLSWVSLLEDSLISD